MCLSMGGASGLGGDSADWSLSPQCQGHSVLIMRSLGAREVLGARKTQKNMADLWSECASPVLALLSMVPSFWGQWSVDEIRHGSHSALHPEVANSQHRRLGHYGFVRLFLCLDLHTGFYLVLWVSGFSCPFGISPLPCHNGLEKRKVHSSV